MKLFMIFIMFFIMSCGSSGDGFSVILSGTTSDGSFTVNAQTSGNTTNYEYEWIFNFTDNTGLETFNCKIDFTAGGKSITKYSSGPIICGDYVPSGVANNPIITVKGSRAQPIEFKYCLKVKGRALDTTIILAEECKTTSSDKAVLPTSPWLTHLGAATVADGGSNGGYDACTVTDIDHTGAVYCAGYTNGAMGEANGGSYDGFLAKINIDGSIAWIKQYGATTVGAGGNNSGLDIFYALRVDRDNGHIYVGGYTTSDMAEANANTANDQVVFKYDLDGNLVYERQFGHDSYPGLTNGNENVTALDFDELGNAYIAGEVSGATWIEPSTGGWDMTLIKLDPAGNVTWLKRLGSTTLAPGADGSGRETCNSLVHHAGYVYCAGEVTSGVAEAHGGGKDAFLVKFDALNGDLVWMSQLGAYSVSPAPATDDAWWSVSIGPDHKSLYLSGTTGGNVGEVAASAEDLLISKYDLSGKNIWHKQYGSVTAGPGGDNSAGAACYMGERYIGANGYFYCAGSVNGNFVEVSAGGSDALFMKLDLEANIIWATQLGSITGFPGQDSSGADYLGKGGAVIDAMGNVYAGGQTDGAIGEGVGGGGQDAYFVKIKEDGSI